MTTTFNVYCDESCHLEHDKMPVMVLGAVWCPIEASGRISAELREIKRRHGLSPNFEAKWSKVSRAKRGYYLNAVDYFFDEDDLHFRALVAHNKEQLEHKRFGQDHDTWYYKMYFEMLKVILNPQESYRIYLDIKDTRGGAKVAKLQDVLRTSLYDFSTSIIERVQIVRSHESDIMQLADLLIGAVSYTHRGFSGNAAKIELVNRLKERSGYSLMRTTLYREDKVNLLQWYPSETCE
jgi:hypothetical protein